MKIRKITAIFLAFVISMAAISPAYARELADDWDILIPPPSEDSVTFEMNGVVITLRYVETPEGDVTFYEYHDGVLMHSSTTYTSHPGKIFETAFVYSDNAGIRSVSALESVIVLDELDMEIIQNVLSEYNNMDAIPAMLQVITYQHQGVVWGLPPTLHRVQVFTSVGFSDTAVFTIRNHVATAAGWGSLFVAGLRIAAGIAQVKVPWAVSVFGGIFVAAGIRFDALHMVSVRTPHTFHFQYLSMPGVQFFPLTLERFLIVDGNHPHIGQTFWEGQFQWRIQWQTPSVWGFFSFAEVIHVHTLSPLYGPFTGWRVHSWW